MQTIQKALGAVIGFLLWSGCGGPLDEAELEVASTQQPLVATSCSSTTNTFVTRSDPTTLRTASHILGAGGSDSTSWGFGETVLTVPVGTRRTTVSTTVRIDQGSVTTMIASPLPASGSYANLRAAIKVVAADGSVLCEQETMMVESWVTAFSDYRVIPAGTLFPLSCTFDHDVRGLAVSARVELRNLSYVFGGESHAEARASYPAFTQQHCGLQLGWCTHSGATLVMLEANGDGKMDQLCHTPSTSHIQMNLTPATGVPDETIEYDLPGFCGGTDVLLAGDVTGDGRDDLLCVTPTTRRVRVKRNLGGTFEAGAVDTTPATPMFCQRPLLADFDGDGDDDLLCQFTSGAAPNIERSDRTGIFNAPDYSIPSCINSLTLRGEYLVGDVNNDGRADLVCHEGGSTPRKIVRLGPSMSATVAAVPSYCSHAGARLVMADANGDGRDDLVCLTDGTGYVHVDFADTATGAFDGTPERSSAAAFCVGGGRVLTSDFNGNGADELVCQQTVPARNTFLPKL